MSIPQADIDDLRGRLRRTRFLDDIENDDWKYGVSTAFLRDVVSYWVEDFDWRAVERDVLNAFPQSKVELDGWPIHFLHVRGTGEDRIPIILCHGWPWTPWDFKKVIGPLTDPAAQGGDPADAFDVVVPSLPGFGFSSPVTKSGATPLVTAGLFVELMGLLGYERFGASGSDWGAFVTAYLAHAHADRLIGAHLTFPALLSHYEIQPDDYGPDEQGWYERMQARLAALPGSHVAPHVGDPQTLGHAFNDSPAGLAAWMLRIRRDGSHIKNGDIESRYTMDELCTLPSVYWFTQSIGTSMRFYADTIGPALSSGASGRGAWNLPLVHDRKPTLEAPTAISVFAYEPIQLPRKIAEQHVNLQQFTFHEEGGHFSAHEEPERWVRDVRAFFRNFR